jgi:arsenate reductase (thioredoxin)
MTDVPHVLFVCSHNAGRSQMAAALLNHEAHGKVQVTSAGSQLARELNPPSCRPWPRSAWTSPASSPSR